VRTGRVDSLEGKSFAFDVSQNETGRNGRGGRTDETDRTNETDGRIEEDERRQGGCSQATAQPQRRVCAQLSSVKHRSTGLFLPSFHPAAQSAILTAAYGCVEYISTYVVQEHRCPHLSPRCCTPDPPKRLAGGGQVSRLPASSSPSLFSPKSNRNKEHWALGTGEKGEMKAREMKPPDERGVCIASRREWASPPAPATRQTHLQVP